MLIYNSKKEFIGIEEHDLNTLGFSSLSQLRTEVADFADMFVKTPGYIHNFKHVNWIDFVTCSDSAEVSKVIIHTNYKSFKCKLDIKTAYLTDDPFSKAFLVYLNNIRELTDSEYESISDDISNRPLGTPIAEVSENFEETAIQSDEQEEIIQEKPFELTKESDTSTQITEEPQEHQLEPISTNLDLPLDLDFYDYEEELEETKTAPKIEESSLEDDLKLDIEESTPKTKEVEYTETELFDNGYLYNPQIASDELGLPVDLIEEFIEDFIAQAKEFKDELYLSLDEGNKDNIKILSHKLKGVAANLRIEDAFEVLTTINTSDDIGEIKTNLDTLYKIISKLSGEKIVVTKNKIIEEPDEFNDEKQEDEIELEFKSDEPTEEINEEPQDVVSEITGEDDDDEILIDFKSDEPKHENQITDNQVPKKIEIPELIDDEFLNQKDEEKIEVDDTLDIETISDEEALSLENELIEMDEIELLDGHDIEDEEILDIDDLEIEPKAIEYNKNTIANEIGIPYDSFLNLLEDYIISAQELSESISNAVEAGDSKIWKNKAIQLKGMSDNMRMHEFTKELETLMKTEDTVVAQDASNVIKKSITEISKLKG
jgi:HPt (histidine-containing phosphotransfer) domain-containing protein